MQSAQTSLALSCNSSYVHPIVRSANNNQQQAQLHAEEIELQSIQVKAAVPLDLFAIPVNARYKIYNHLSPTEIKQLSQTSRELRAEMNTYVGHKYTYSPAAISCMLKGMKKRQVDRIVVPVMIENLGKIAAVALAGSGALCSLFATTVVGAKGMAALSKYNLFVQGDDLGLIMRLGYMCIRLIGLIVGFWIGIYALCIFSMLFIISFAVACEIPRFFEAGYRSLKTKQIQKTMQSYPVQNNVLNLYALDRCRRGQSF